MGGGGNRARLCAMSTASCPRIRQAIQVHSIIQKSAAFTAIPRDKTILANKKQLRRGETKTPLNIYMNIMSRVLLAWFSTRSNGDHKGGVIQQIGNECSITPHISIVTTPKRLYTHNYAPLPSLPPFCSRLPLPLLLTIWATCRSSCTEKEEMSKRDSRPSRTFFNNTPFCAI